MMTDITGLNDSARISSRRFANRSDADILRMFAIVAGVCVSLLFVELGLRYELQAYADGSLFSYAVAVRDAWAFHCHNISGRLSVYLLAFVPAEAYVRLTGDPQGGIAFYGFLFFVAQLCGLIASYAIDRSRSKLLFSYACASTACLCPLVFGFPTEVWMMHALFWPTLAACHYARRSLAGSTLIFLLMLAMVFTHAGALISAAAILATTALRGWRDPAFRRASNLVFLVVAIWAIVKLTLRPDDYIAGVLVWAALHVFEIGILTGPLMLLLFGTLASYVVAVVMLQRFSPTRAHIYAASLVAIGLAAYWLRFDHALHAANRYYMRTVLLVATPALGMIAAVFVVAADGELSLTIPYLPRVLALLSDNVVLRAASGALALVLLVHAVENAKFFTAWTEYKDALRTAVMGTASDPALGDPRFVSASRNGLNQNALSWVTTTPFLSVLLAPNLKPARLVVDSDAGYFWLSCRTATANLDARRAVPAQSRELIKIYSCLHRKH